ncbi:hypothetical protein CFP56_036869 [Quercus suber]|uniref:3'-5' exonuclease n=1 Tax=Quercus suber TaxID=58331 RepID=A0AAW0LN66_QUESU
MASSPPSPHQTHIPLPPDSDSGDKPLDHEANLKLVPIHIVTDASQLPAEFLEPSPENQLLAFSDAIYLVDASQGGEMLMRACKPALESTYITKVVHDCKRDSEALYFQFGIKLNNVVDTQDPKFWTYRPLSELMVRAAADDVRFLLYIYHKMMEKLNQRSLWYLAVRGALYCRCFCINDNDHADWPSLPPIPENIIMDHAPEEEILSVLDVPPGKMGRVIGRKGVTILSIKESCNAEILIGGAKGPPDKF